MKVITAQPVAFIGDENAPGSAPAFLSRKGSRPVIMKQRRPTQAQSLEERLGIEADRFRREGLGTPPGIEHDRLIRKARLAETTSELSEWLRSPGLRAPT